MECRQPDYNDNKIKNENYNLYVELEDYSEHDEIVIESLSLKDHYSNNIYECDGLPLSTSIDNDTIKAVSAYLSSITTAKNDKVFTLKFNSKIDETTVDDTIVTLTNSNEDYFNLDLSLSENDEQIILNKQRGYFTNDFYTINIFPELRSKGGNNLTTTISYPFYVPFH